MKKLFFNLTLIAMSATSLIFTSCEKDNENDNPEPNPVVENKLSGSIQNVKNLESTIEYILTGPMIIEEGGVLNIPAGTTIKAQGGFGSYILVLQGGKININGTSQSPVTFTADISNAGQGYWGGLIINGRAPLSGGETGSTETNSAYSYGGTDPSDNSGTITYLKLEYTGARSSADVEHNGLTLNGVGNGTKIENIFVPNGADDGIEFFGGTVNVKNLLVLNSDDDMFDASQGWSGTIENAYGIWEEGYISSESDPRGVEADGNLDGNNPEQEGQSDFTIKNMTIDLRLAPKSDEGYYMHDVIKVRRGAKATITNALVKGTGQVKDLIDMKDGKGKGNSSSLISITNNLTAAITGSEINGEAQVTIESGNTGCPTDIFSWTGYQF